MRLQGCCHVACVLLIWWLAQLFDLDYEEVLHKVPWSSLLQHVAQRLDGDMEDAFMAEFPWELSHLSVHSICCFPLQPVVLSGRGASLLRGLQDCSSVLSFVAQSFHLRNCLCVWIPR